MNHEIEFLMPGQQAAQPPTMPGQPADACIPLFSMRAVQNNAKTRDAGRPIFDEVEWVKILVPGDRDSPERKVRDADRQRWPHQYANFQANKRASVEGTPLERWPLLDVARCAELRALNILTVEAVAGLSDDAIGKIGPGTAELVKQAKEFLQFAAGETKAASALEIAEQKVADQAQVIAEQQRQIEELEATVQEQNGTIAELQEQMADVTPTRRGGRK